VAFVPPGLPPALAVLGGAVAGTFTDASVASAPPVVAALCLAAALAWWRSASKTASACVVSGFFLAATALAIEARDRALNSSLRSLLEKEVGGFLLDTIGPEKDHPPFRVRTRLLEDASIRDDYVSLRANVVALETAGGWQSVEGGVTLTVGGDAAADLAGEWRAGRVLESRTTFRRPARYLNDGVADFERQVAFEGTTLFGSVKSALIVDVIQPGSAFDEWAADVRAHVRSAVQRWVAPHDVTAAAIVTAVLIGDRTGLTGDVPTVCSAPARITSSPSPVATSRCSPDSRSGCWRSPACMAASAL
jgi:predicted membrane metal-binding protein